MKNNKIIIIGIIVVAIIILGISLMISYNKLIIKKEDINSKLANVSVQLERRADLIPNLVNTIKGYTNHETKAIELVTTAREKMVNANSVEEKSNADQELTTALNNLFIIVENYPDLKANDNFIQLQDELAGTENRIAVSRNDYNTSVKTYNESINKFPTNLFARVFGFDKAEYFKADESKTEVPNVTF